jgi:hypothetical protein
MADQCIICFDTLDSVSPSENNSLLSDVASGAAQVAPTALGHDSGNTPPNNQLIARIQTCGHILHNECLQAWIEKANSCPMCRQAFHQVEVYDKVGGTSHSSYNSIYRLPSLIPFPGKLLSTYTVEDKKQVAEFDPSAWIDDQVEELESTPCPICDSADNEEVLLLCDACDAPYHTHCVGLDRVPHGHWFCMECVHEGAHARSADLTRLQRPNRHPRTFAQRTQAQVRRARRRAPADDWQSAWNQISGRVWDALNLDLDYSDDDEALTTYRQHQRRTERERREFAQWQQRLNIASRQGARDIFRDAARPILSLSAQQRPKTPEPTPEEAKAWEAFEHVREAESSGSNSRKRKARSITRSPVEQSAEPERKLKRPKTRRVVNRTGSPLGENASRRNSSAPAVSTTQRAAVPSSESVNAPSFLSSLLKEVEMSTSTDDESIHPPLGNSATSPSVEHSSPAVSPPTSNYSTPRALSITPPPYRSRRPGSPLPLTSHVEPIFPPADYSPNRSTPELNQHSDVSSPTHEIRQPRPRRKQASLPRSEEASPNRPHLSIEAKEGINKIVRTALEPHYRKPAGITKEQYANINRLVSRMLYDRIVDPDALDENERSAWQKIAVAEVTKAVEGLSA